jgi:hypothetical protein
MITDCGICPIMGPGRVAGVRGEGGAPRRGETGPALMIT